MTLAVYHASADVERHLAPLRRSGRFALRCVPQRSGPLHVSADGVDGVLWEVDGHRRPDRRRLGALSRRLPVVSYSAETGRAALAASKTAGFRGHLTAPLDPADVERELGVSAPAALAARQAAFLKELRRAPRRVAVLEAVLRAVSTTRVPERMAGHLVDLAFEWFGADGWAVLAADDTRGLQWLADRGVTADRRPAVIEVAGRTARGQRAIWASEAASVGRTRSRGRFSAVGLPLRSHGRVVGVLVGLDARPGAAFDVRPERLAPLLVLLDGAGGALDVAQRLKRANALSSVDDLTGLFNARCLNATLRREVKRAVRTGRPLSLLFVDLDGFKGVNDRYGHLYGSRALVEAAGRIHAAARETDMVARYGGDEFSVVLPDTGQDGAMLVARRVRERVASHTFLAADGIGYRLTASVGAATMPGCALTPEGLLAAADAAMYRVKGRGKDGIEMADLLDLASKGGA